MNLKQLHNSNSESEFWTAVAKQMMKIVWHYSDIALPDLTNIDYRMIETNEVLKMLQIALGFTNLIDSLVGDLIEDGSMKAVKHLSGFPGYEDILLFLNHQAASEIVHQKTYKIQFDMMTDPLERQSLVDMTTNILMPLKEYCENKTPEQLLVLGVVIESILIPTVFKIIDDVKMYDKSSFTEQICTIITCVSDANKLIFRDEMIHVSGGSQIVRELIRYKIIDYRVVNEIIKFVEGIVATMIKTMCPKTPIMRIDNKVEDYTTLLTDMVSMTHAIMRGHKIMHDDFVGASVPSVDSFFRGTVTSYLNGDIKTIPNLTLTLDYDW